jgi:hypothetical protein
MAGLEPIFTELVFQNQTHKLHCVGELAITIALEYHQAIYRSVSTSGTVVKLSIASLSACSFSCTINSSQHQRQNIMATDFISSYSLMLMFFLSS